MDAASGLRSETYFEVECEFLDDYVPSYIPHSHWPPHSPDLNPIENLWATLKEKIYWRNPRTIAELKKVAQEEWKKIPMSRIQTLVDSMENRLAAVRRAKGGTTRY